MFKLITPPSLLLATAFLVVYAAYAFMIGVIEQSFLLLAAGLVSIIGCIGTALMKPWSRALIIGLTVGAVIKLASSILAAAEAGFFDFQFGSTAAALRSLAPETAMVLLGVVCSVLVWSEFKRRKADGAEI